MLSLLVAISAQAASTTGTTPSPPPSGVGSAWLLRWLGRSSIVRRRISLSTSHVAKADPRPVAAKTAASVARIESDIVALDSFGPYAGGIAPGNVQSCITYPASRSNSACGDGFVPGLDRQNAWPAHCSGIWATKTRTHESHCKALLGQNVLRNGKRAASRRLKPTESIRRMVASTPRITANDGTFLLRIQHFNRNDTQ